jgi:hypothetical protein
LGWTRSSTPLDARSDQERRKTRGLPHWKEHEQGANRGKAPQESVAEEALQESGVAYRTSRESLAERVLGALTRAPPSLLRVLEALSGFTPMRTCQAAGYGRSASVLSNSPLPHLRSEGNSTPHALSYGEGESRPHSRKLRRSSSKIRAQWIIRSKWLPRAPSCRYIAGWRALL